MASFSLFLSLRRLRLLRLVLLLAGPVLGLLSGCTTTRYYRQRTMFQLSTDAKGVADTAKFRRLVNRTARNYRLHPNDLLNVQVYTNRGERILDPNGELRFGTPGTGSAVGVPNTVASGGQGPGQRSAGATLPGSTQFLVQADGTVRLPLLAGPVRVQDLTLLQADSLLARRYEEFYKGAFVKTAVANNRVIMLGASGNQVISLPNDNMNLLEVLALAGGADGGGSGGQNNGFARHGGRMDNIRILRGDLKNPQVQFVDLSTFQGMRRGSLQVEPNDVIYIEPVRRPLQDALADTGPVLGAVSALLGAVSIALFAYIQLKGSK